MTATETLDAPADHVPSKGGGKGLLIGLVLALAAGGGGFYAVWSGLILDDAANHDIAGADAPSADEFGSSGADEDIAFVPVEAITVSLPPGAGAAHLRFRAQLEVPATATADVEKLLPRIVDVLNGYLRAVEPTSLERPDILSLLRSQMLRRVRLVVGDDRVRDLLIMEFFLK